MLRLLLFLPMLFLLFGCGKAITPPVMTLHTLEDIYEPCVKVEFPDQVRLESFSVANRDNDAILIYKLIMPKRNFYELKVVKRHLLTSEAVWSIDILPDQHSVLETVYSIDYTPEFPTRSAVLRVTEKEGELYLRASIVDFVDDKDAVLIVVDRKIQSLPNLRFRTAKEFLQSDTGQKFENDMKAMTDKLYNSMEIVECNNLEKVDMIWW